MRMLVLGGTVFLSRAVAEAARDRGHDVTVANRGRSATPPAGVRPLRVDRDDPDGLAPLGDGGEAGGEAFDAVVDVARQPSHVRRALALLGDRAAHWTFVSSGSVYADEVTTGQHVGNSPVLAPHAEDDGTVDTYGPRKVACEDAVRDALGERAFICRAGLIAGPGDAVDRFGWWVVRLARGGEILAPGAPDGAAQVIDVRDLADWIVLAAERGLAGTFDGIGPATTLGHLLERVAAGVGVEPRLTWVDQAFLLEHGVNPWMGARSLPMWVPLPQYAGFMSRDGGPSFAVGLATRDLAETARDTLTWEREVAGDHDFAAGLTAAEEDDLLRAWKAR
jgi:nucleoside-diphosphate-sugar epimerase